MYLRTLNQLTNENILINTKISLTYDGITSSDQFILEDLISAYPVLIFDLGNINCTKCLKSKLDQEISLFKQFLQNIDTDKVLILSNYGEIYDIETFLRLHQIDNISIYNKKTEMLALPLESLDIPFMFLLYENHKTSNVFIPDPNLPKLTQQYLEFVKTKLSK